MPMERAGLKRVQGKITKRNETEFSRELSENDEKSMAEKAGVQRKTTERPTDYEIYPGE